MFTAKLLNDGFAVDIIIYKKKNKYILMNEENNEYECGKTRTFMQ